MNSLCHLHILIFSIRNLSRCPVLIAVVCPPIRFYSEPISLSLFTPFMLYLLSCRPYLQHSLRLLQTRRKRTVEDYQRKVERNN